MTRASSSGDSITRKSSPLTDQFLSFNEIALLDCHHHSVSVPAYITHMAVKHSLFLVNTSGRITV